MKTQILTLDAHDDYISARDKISWTQAGRILIVWPDGEQVLNRYLDLVLLLRHASRMGAQLALVTRDTNIRHHAQQLGIPVFHTLAKAHRSRWRPGRRRRTISPIRRHSSRKLPLDFEKLYAETHPEGPKWMQNLLFRSIVFTLGVFALLALASLLLPEARIIVQPRSQIQEIELTVHASPDIKTLNITGSLPANYQTVIVEGRAVLPAGGSSRVPQNYATGSLQLTNLTENEVVISEGMVVRNPDDDTNRFMITRDGKVPAGVGESATFPIRAMLPGSNGNLSAGMLTMIEGQTGLNLVATNTIPTSGGSDITVPTPLSSDQDELYDILEKSLFDSARDEFIAQNSADDLVVTNGMELTQVIEKTYDPPSLQPAEEISLSLRLEYQAPVIKFDDIRALAIAILDANLAAGYVPVDDSIEVSHLSAPRIDQVNSITWDLKATWSIKAQISEAHLINLVIGLPNKIALQRLEAALPIDGEPQISMTPGWWPRLPYLPFRIQVSSVE